MPKKNPFRDGVRKLAPGKFELCLTYKDAAGKRRDTDRIFYCETRPDAIAERARLISLLEAKANGWTVAHALQRLYPTVRPSTRESWKSWGRAIESAMGDRVLNDITPADLRRFLRSLPISDASAKNVRTVLVRMFENAKIEGAFNGANPATEAKPRRTQQTDEEMLREMENPPRRAMLGDEVTRFLSVLNPDIRPLITVQLLLGCRFGEASALQWSDIEWDTGRVKLYKGQFKGLIGPNKAGVCRWGALGPYGLTLLREHRANMAALQWPGFSTWCFPRPLSARRRDHDLWPASTAIKLVKAAQKEAGLELVSRTHSMRHTFITAHAAQATHAADAALMRSMVGHASEAQSRTYIDGRAALATGMERGLLGDLLGDGVEK